MHSPNSQISPPALLSYRDTGDDLHWNKNRQRGSFLLVLCAMESLSMISVHALA